MFEHIYKREYYFNMVKGFIHDDMIKVITGIRRSGKSSFMKSITNHLEETGINKKDIIYIDLNKRGLKHLRTADALEKIIDENIKDNDYKYVFIDEIQNINEFESVIEAFRLTGNISIFITGSNSYLLSGELATKLTGRYIEIEMFPLNFYEYLKAKKYLNKKTNDNISEEFNEYIKYGGFPKALEYDLDDEKSKYIESIFDQVIEKDIKKFHKIKNRLVFEKVLTYIINNFGATTSITNIQKYFNENENIPIKQETIYKYINIIENAKLIYKCKRFDLRSKKSLKGEQKYYLADLGLYFSHNVDARQNLGPILENILFTYLTSKGYKLSIGKIGTLECDFITRKDNEYYYIQVATSIADRSVEDREYNVFTKIKDNYPKYLFTLDNLLQKRNGIIHYNLIDFIKNNSDL